MSSAVVKQFSLDEEYKKKTGITREDINKLREWLKTQPHLPEQHITDMDLILIYNCCNLSSSVSKQLLDLNFTLRTLFTNFFEDRYVNAKLETAIKCCLFTLLERRSDEGYAVFYGRLTENNSKNFILSEVLRLQIMTIDLYQYEEGTWPGIILVYDLAHSELAHIKKLDIQSVQQFLYFLQEAMLVNMKGFHIINAPSFIDKLMMIMKPFMKPALMDVFHIHTVGSRTIDQVYPMEALPKDAGGTYKSCKELEDNIIAKLKANTDFFLEEKKKRVVESLRPESPKTISDIFQGMEGSFKKLNLD